jgi:hypothetical protein
MADVAPVARCESSWAPSVLARIACMSASGVGWIRHHVAASHARTPEIVSESVLPYMMPKLFGVTGQPLLPEA